MDRKAVSGIMLTLLLTGMLTIVFNIQTVKLEPVREVLFFDDIKDELWTEQRCTAELGNFEVINGEYFTQTSIGGRVGLTDPRADVFFDNFTIWSLPQTHHVYPNQSIQEAINSAQPGDKIFVHAGTYYEHVIVNKTVTLIGENKVATIIDCDMTATVVAVTADNVTISEFTIRNGGNRYAGISLSSNRNNINNNIIWDNWCGISLEDYSAYNVIVDNSIMDNLNGISGELWSDSEIIGNTLKDNLLGIWIGPYSSRNTIAFNNIANHCDEGISMWQSSYNVIVGNNITDNNQGGHWAGIVVGFSSYNQFFHNNIANKGKQIDLQGEVVNTWDDSYPSGGNYWSDYTGVDLYGGAYQNETGGDGIGDTQYVIDKNNQDNYPLTEPWSTPIMHAYILVRTVKFWNLHKGTENSLTSKLEGAPHLLDTGKENGAVHKLMAFVNQVEALREKKLTNEQADYLIAAAQEIIDLIEG